MKNSLRACRYFFSWNRIVTSWRRFRECIRFTKNARIMYILTLDKCTKKTIPCFSEVCTVQGVVTLESPVEWCLPGGVCFLEPVNENGIFKSEANIIQLRVQEMTRTKVKIMLKQHKNKNPEPIANTWSTPTWTKFYPILTTYPPRLDNCDHFTYNLPFVPMTQYGLSTDHLLPLLVHVVIECPHTR